MHERGRPDPRQVHRAHLWAFVGVAVALTLVARIAWEQATAPSQPRKPPRTPMDPTTLPGILDVFTVCFFGCMGLGAVWQCVKGLLTRPHRVVAWPLPASSSTSALQPLAAMAVVSDSPPPARRRVAASTSSYLDTPEAFSRQGDDGEQKLTTVVVIAGLAQTDSRRDSELRPPLMDATEVHQALHPVQVDDASLQGSERRPELASASGQDHLTVRRCAVCARALRSDQRVSALRACAHVSLASRRRCTHLLAAKRTTTEPWFCCFARLLVSVLRRNYTPNAPSRGWRWSPPSAPYVSGMHAYFQLGFPHERLLDQHLAQGARSAGPPRRRGSGSASRAHSPPSGASARLRVVPAAARGRAGPGGPAARARQARSERSGRSAGRPSLRRTPLVVWNGWPGTKRAARRWVRGLSRRRRGWCVWSQPGRGACAGMCPHALHRPWLLAATYLMCVRQRLFV